MNLCNFSIYIATSYICLILLLLAPNVKPKKFTRCEFAVELRKALTDVEWKYLGNWMCMAEANSKLETNYTYIDPAEKTLIGYGVFAHNNRYRCKDDIPGTNNENMCGETCSSFLDDDVSNDIHCARKVRLNEIARVLSGGNRDGGNGFHYWKWAAERCKGDNFPEYKYLENVTPDTAAPRIANELTNITLVIGSMDQYLECVVVGSPLANFSWEYDHEMFPELKSFIFHDKNNTSILRLVFPQIQSYYSGIYTCITKNYCGEISSEFYLNTIEAGESNSGEHDKDQMGPSYYWILIGFGIGVGLMCVISGFACLARQFYLTNYVNKWKL